MVPIPAKERDTKTLAVAIQKVQKSFPEIVADSTNPHFGSRYASLAQINKAIKPVLSANKLSIHHSIKIIEDGQMVLSTKLWHECGEDLSSEILLLNKKGDCQGLGSALTYSMRYNISALLNLATEKSDDDGNAASQNKSDASGEIQF